MIADAQAPTDNADNPEKVQNILQALTARPRSDPWVKHPHLHPVHGASADRAEFIIEFVTVSVRACKSSTVKSEIRDEPETSTRRVTPTPSAAADITAFGATTVPAGEGIDVGVGANREIADKFNAVYADLSPCLRSCCPRMLPAQARRALTARLR